MSGEAVAPKLPRAPTPPAEAAAGDPHIQVLRHPCEGVATARNHALSIAHAPHWRRHPGLDRLFRLRTEPRRLWRRYAAHNPRFVGLFAAQLLRTRARSDGRARAAR